LDTRREAADVLLVQRLHPQPRELTLSVIERLILQLLFFWIMVVNSFWSASKCWYRWCATREQLWDHNNKLPILSRDWDTSYKQLI